eukprot:TRINITY_DN20865_c0_g1_i1.p1 TRINITY_DN20865_c0_g1~~TRINITY_DN20865_c0_g1_i1.p1  ORF type:complete len:474 (+),score=90.53 TRINITY_DN20865_c0_g1_i1:161-1582(+)
MTGLKVGNSLTGLAGSLQGLMSGLRYERIASGTREGVQGESDAKETGGRGTVAAIPPEKSVEALRQRLQKEREGLTLYGRPFETLKYFSLAVGEQLGSSFLYSVRSGLLFVLPLLVAAAFGVLIALDSEDRQYMATVWAYGRFVLWWMCLGVASTIGLGSGLHTFVLYLGPHIARFTLKATACGRVDFKMAPYDTAQWLTDPTWFGKDCSKFGPPLFPHTATERGGYYSVPLLQLMAAVELESFLWGVGTAIGELPPYFVSRAARLSGEKVMELEELEQEKKAADENASFFQRIKLKLFSRASAFGFVTIFLFASIPNPLFDLAGITCGHFLVPFWKFFLATALGKSLIKTSLQTIFIVTVFNAHSLELLEDALERVLANVPLLYNQVPAVMEAVEGLRERLSGGEQKSVSPLATLAVSLWQGFVALMFLAFLVSIISSTAHGFLIERHRRELAAFRLQQTAKPPSSSCSSSS